MGQHSNLYKKPVWRDALRPSQLAKEPLCAFCLRRGIETLATVVDHITPHRGDWDLFCDTDNLQSLCKSCHDGEKQSEEVRGHSTSIGEDGWPVDDRHPFISKSENLLKINKSEG